MYAEYTQLQLTFLALEPCPTLAQKRAGRGGGEEIFKVHKEQKLGTKKDAFK